MPVGKLTPEVAHNRSKNPIDSSSHSHQPETDSTGLCKSSLLETKGKWSPEHCGAQRRQPVQKNYSKKRDFIVCLYYFCTCLCISLELICQLQIKKRLSTPPLFQCMLLTQSLTDHIALSGTEHTITDIQTSEPIENRKLELYAVKRRQQLQGCISIVAHQPAVQASNGSKHHTHRFSVQPPG